jgi:acetate---CoA ligase (ADP-forming)
MFERSSVLPKDLTKLLRPQSVAIVGASERQERSRAVVRNLIAANLRIFLINPNRPTAFGLETYPSVEAIGEPVDVVFASVNAAAAVEQVAQAAALGVGGVVVNAGGFGESGVQGLQLQERLLEVAGQMPILGPNCNGYIDQNRGVRLSGAPSLPILPGSIGFITHSGALIGSFGAACAARGLGMSHMISTGNEARLDMTDMVEFMSADPATKVICLAVESVRRPRAFIAAIEKAIDAGKPVLALKLGRSKSGQAIAQSHTGALSGDAWTYDTVFRQLGIEIAYDLTELADRAACFEQLPRERWSQVNGLAIVTASGGGAGMASDLCEQMGVDLPSLYAIGDQVREIVPSATVVNPLDMTGFAVGNPAAIKSLLESYESSRDVDTLFLQWFVDDAGAEHGEALLGALEQIAPESTKTLVLGSLEDGPVGARATHLSKNGVAIGRGLPNTIRGLQSMGRFMRRANARKSDLLAAGDALFSPTRKDAVPSQAGEMLDFRASMSLLESAGFEVAPYRVVGLDDDAMAAAKSLDGPYVVKVANIPHRTELGAVRTNVTLSDIASAVAAMRSLAIEQGLPTEVVIQTQLSGKGEFFVGVNGVSQFGPMILCGAGGVLVEALGGVQGALAPLRQFDVDTVVAELRKNPLVAGYRGSEPVSDAALNQVLVAANRLATGSAGWLQSGDINPLIYSGGRFVAVDGLFLLR